MKHKNNLKLDDDQRNKMRKAGRFNARLMDYIRPFIFSGTTTRQIDRLVYNYTVSHGNIPATLGYKGFPASCCVSPNDIVCHGIPNDYVLKDGDIVNIDLTSIVDGWHGDSSETFIIGEVSPAVKGLVQTTFDAMWEAINVLKPGDKVIKIGTTIVSIAYNNKLSVVKEYQGHGIGRTFHQKPDIPHFPTLPSGAFALEPGICFTIEPMLNIGSWETTKDPDNWTVRTKDNSLSAQFEHTILMTEYGPEVLTLTKSGPQCKHIF